MLVADAVLGERLREGDVQAFGDLYERHAQEVFDFLVRLVRDRAVAEDLVQTTFIQAFEHRSALKDPASVRPWLWSTAHNLALNHLKRRRPAENVEEQYDLAEPRPGPEDVAMSKEAARLVWAAAASLEPRQYAVLDLSVRHDLSTTEIAQSLGVDSGHAAVLVHRAHEALGNAVRYLLVARRRDDCPQLAAMVPAGVRSLKPEQRASVDHHMRRCERCRELGNRLTDPVELFGGLVALPMPAWLMQNGASTFLDTINRGTTPGKGVRGGKQAATSSSGSATHGGVLSALAIPAQAAIGIAVAAAIAVAAPVVHVSNAYAADVITPADAGRLFQAAWQVAQDADRSRSDSQLSGLYSGEALASTRLAVLSPPSDFEKALSIKQVAVPHQTGFPATFAAVGHIDTTTGTTKSGKNVLAFFVRNRSADHWTANVLNFEDDKTPAPTLALAKDGYAPAVSTASLANLLVPPEKIPTLYAKYLTDGIAGKPLGTEFAAGPYTTDVVKAVLEGLKQGPNEYASVHYAYNADSTVVPRAYLLADGSALVFFSMGSTIDAHVATLPRGWRPCVNFWFYFTTPGVGPYPYGHFAAMHELFAGGVIAIDPPAKGAQSSAGATAPETLRILSMALVVKKIDGAPC